MADTIATSAGVDGAPMAPRWERRFPGRMEFELTDLRSAGVEPRVDGAALTAGVLILDFTWRVNDDVTVELRAVFPDEFPHIRPTVTLLSGMEPPKRHINPLFRNLCLLGRDSAQWVPSLTLRKLLEEKLANALLGGGEEDPQAEPVEIWWNVLAVPGSMMLIDSAWDLPADRGKLVVRYALGRHEGGHERGPIIRGVVTEVRDAAGALLHAFEGALPSEIVTANQKPWVIPWQKVNAAVLPEKDEGARTRQIQEVLKAGGASDARVVAGDSTMALLSCFVYPSEISLGRTGPGWTFLQVSGHPRSFDKNHPNARKQRQMQRASTVAVYRAGPRDLGERVPAVATLRAKRVLVVGLGAVGAPAAVELARNQVGTLHLLDYDVVEPGISVRWPIGTSSWGWRKLSALVELLRREHPGTRVEAHPHVVGEGPSDALLDALLPQIDLVIDGSASHGVTCVLAERCRERAIPLISLFATPTVEGGAVVRHSGGGGCPNCLEHAWHREEIVPPRGRGRDDVFLQAAGCGDRTFVGAGFDLQELSLQAVRLAVETLQQGAGDSVVQTLSFGDGASSSRLPQWRQDALPHHPKCACRSR